jgi:hypothetical protein
MVSGCLPISSAAHHHGLIAAMTTYQPAGLCTQLCSSHFLLDRSHSNQQLLQRMVDYPPSPCSHVDGHCMVVCPAQVVDTYTPQRPTGYAHPAAAAGTAPMSQHTTWLTYLKQICSHCDEPTTQQDASWT